MPTTSVVPVKDGAGDPSKRKWKKQQIHELGCGRKLVKVY